jgi:very-short-patch-repair endonuclease
MFRRNQPIDGYVVDFFCARSRVAVELGVDRQTTRVGKYLEQKGYSVIRVGHTEAEEDPSGVAAQIVDLCKDLDPG